MNANDQMGGVVILGMHRSGTSAVAGFLAKAGFFAGEAADLLEAAEDNPKGFFERADVNALNDNFLAELDGAWDRPPGRELILEQAADWRPQVEEVLSSLAEEAAGRPLVLKDPRISLLLPAWLPALDQGRFVIVLVDRSPMDVALSVRKRDGRPLYVALAIWQLYCTELLEGLAGRRVLLVRYEDFVEDPARSGPSSSGSWRRCYRPSWRSELRPPKKGLRARGRLGSWHQRCATTGQTPTTPLTNRCSRVRSSPFTSGSASSRQAGLSCTRRTNCAASPPTLWSRRLSTSRLWPIVPVWRRPTTTNATRRSTSSRRLS